MLGVVLLFIYVTICLFVFGFFKFLGKVAQSNILPATVDVVPFDDESFTLNDNPIRVYVGKDSDDTVMSREIYFPKEENIEHQKQTIGFFYDSVHDKRKSSMTMLYFYLMAQSLLAMDFYLINKIFGFIDRTFYDFIIILHGIHVLPIIWHILVVVNCFYLPFLWLYNFCYFWYDTEDDPNDIEKIRYIPRPIQFLLFSGNFLTGLEIWMLLWLLIILGFIIVPLTAVLFATYAFFYPLGLICRSKNNNEAYGVYQIVKDILMYQHSFVSYFVTFTLLIFINTNYGYVTALVFFVAAICLCLMTKAFENNKILDKDLFTTEKATYEQTVKIIEKPPFQPVVAKPVDEKPVVGTVVDVKPSAPPAEKQPEPSAPPLEEASATTEEKKTKPSAPPEEKAESTEEKPEPSAPPEESAESTAEKPEPSAPPLKEIAKE